jgi:hypothetical protein
MRRLKQLLYLLLDLPEDYSYYQYASSRDELLVTAGKYVLYVTS